MNRRPARTALALACLLTATAAGAQARLRDIGRTEFETSCAGCHGASAKGDGPLKAWLLKAPSDLTLLAQRNGGVFPFQQVREVIDGRTPTEIGPHGSREMPIWGSVYRGQAITPGEGELSPEWTATLKLMALTDYLARIQVR
jgi:mono/diheme cytochrome c family protein